MLEELSLKIGYLCKFCNKELSNKSNLTRHIKDTCNIKKQLIDDKLNIINRKENKLNEINKNKKLKEIKIAELNKDIKINKLENKLKKLKLNKKI